MGDETTTWRIGLLSISNLSFNLSQRNVLSEKDFGDIPTTTGPFGADYARTCLPALGYLYHAYVLGAAPKLS